MRDQSEFTFGGEASIVRPTDPEATSDQEWADYLFYRDNVKGLHGERWLHSFGCRQWFLAERDTVTHEISGTRRLDGATAGSAGQGTP